MVHVLLRFLEGYLPNHVKAVYLHQLYVLQTYHITQWFLHLPYHYDYIQESVQPMMHSNQELYCHHNQQNSFLCSF